MRRGPTPLPHALALQGEVRELLKGWPASPLLVTRRLSEARLTRVSMLRPAWCMPRP